MNFNNVDIDIATDYTAFTNTVTFRLTVPVAEADASAIYKSMMDGKWTDTEQAIATAITNSAPTQVQSLATTLMNAYTGSRGKTTPAAGNSTNQTDATTDTASNDAG